MERKRKLEDDPSSEILYGEGPAKVRAVEEAPKKHSLDSDEEEEGNSRNYDILRDDDIEGQEEKTVEFDGDIQIMPFNMQEELEEGHFDKDGHYIRKDDKELVKDHWLDNIDWVKVKERQAEANEDEDDEDTESLGQDEIMKAYEEILSILQPGETVAKALTRLGGGKKKKPLSSLERLKMKKRGEMEDAEDAENKAKMLKLTGLADGLLTSLGDMDVYQYTYESVKHKMDILKPSKDPMDMFADDDDPRIHEKEQASKPDNVTWEWRVGSEKEVKGPFSSEKMKEMKEVREFPEGDIQVRQICTEGKWYSLNRIDFDLYL